MKEGENGSVQVAAVARRAAGPSSDPARRDSQLQVLVILGKEVGLGVDGRLGAAEQLANARQSRVATAVLECESQR